MSWPRWPAPRIAIVCDLNKFTDYAIMVLN